MSGSRERKRQRRRKPQPSRDLGVPLPSTPAAPGEGVSCPIAGACGGCALLGVDARAQAEFKRAVLSAALAEHTALAGVTVDETIPSPAPAAYRGRAKLALEAEGATLRLGLFRRGTRELLDLAPCRIHRPPIQSALEPLRAVLAEHQLAQPAGPLKYVDLREAADEGLFLTLVAEREPGPLPLDALRAALPALVGIALNLQPARSSYVFGEETRMLWGSPRFRAPSQTPLTLPALGFFQVNAALLPRLHALMAAHLGESGPLLDLYCGIGVHGLALVGEHERLLGIESDEGAIAAARENAGAAAARCRFVAGPVEERLPAELEAFGPAERAVLNPSRPGCRPAVIEALAAHPPARLAYLSCNPHTLARDLAHLVERGFVLERVLPVDMMPQTDQVEALALLSFR